MTRSRLLLLLTIAAAIAAFFLFDLGRYFTLAEVKARQAEFAAAVGARPLQSAAIFFAVYVLATALSLPGAATVMTLLAGALFGLGWGVLLVSFASSVGATLAFLIGRTIARDWIMRRIGAWPRFRAIDRAVGARGAPDYGPRRHPAACRRGAWPADFTLRIRRQRR
jgi:uncharacterized membrane protein YdjX (TVP38/TMEM64 family)